MSPADRRCVRGVLRPPRDRPTPTARPLPADAAPRSAAAAAATAQPAPGQMGALRPAWPPALVVGLVLGLRPAPVAVETAAVSARAARVTVDEDGRTRVTDRYIVSAPLAGTLARPALRAGDSVRQGEVVARLVPVASPLLDPRARTEAEARVAAARAALSQAGTAVARARAARDFARRDAERQRTLLAAGATAPQAAEQAELAERTRRRSSRARSSGRGWPRRSCGWPRPRCSGWTRREPSDGVRGALAGARAGCSACCRRARAWSRPGRR